MSSTAHQPVLSPPSDADVQNIGDEFVEAIARRVVELLGERDAPRAVLVDAQTVADRFGVGRDWVYANADRLGVVRVGGGSRPRLRFDLEQVWGALEHGTARHVSERSHDREAPPEGRIRRRRRRTTMASARSVPDGSSR